MKKSLIALAAMAATASFAQSSVTISGLLDAGIQSVKLGNDVTQTKVGSGIHGASRLRFVGVEDLGGGNKANFWLEMQPNFETGTASADLFNRGAWLGLSGGWGEVRVGRQGTNAVAAVCGIDLHGCYSGFSGGGILFSGQAGPGAQGGAWFAANPTRGGAGQAASTLGTNYYANSANAGVDSTRYIRAVRYTLPTLTQGLEINATHAFGQVASATAGAAGNSQGVDVTYAAGALKLVGAYQKANADQGADKSGELTTVGGQYNLGVAVLSAGVQNEKASGTGLAFSKGESFTVGAAFPMGATTPYVKLGEHKYSGGTLGSVTNAKITNVGARYALSKRTNLYADYVNNSATVAATGSKSMTSVGIQHTF